MTVGLLITNYNTWDLTSKCIENCIAYADERIDQFVVVDDCSTEKFDNKFKEITLIRNSKNQGLVKSLNIGLANIHTDLVILFDSDAWPLEPYIEKTKQFFFKKPFVGIAAYQTEKADGRSAPSYSAEPVALSLVLGQKINSYFQKWFQKKTENITVFTCAMIIRKEVLNQIGVFDENYDWLELDHDICMRATRKGWKISIVPVRAFHKGSGTPQLVSHRVIRYYKNRIRLLRKFDKYPAEKVLNFIILIRLYIELSVLQIFGKLKYKKDVLNDKMASRTTLIKLFKSGDI